MAKLFRSTESIFKLGLLAFFLLLMWTGRDYPERSRFLPQWLCGIGAFLIILSFILPFVKPKGEEKKEEIKKPKPPSSDVREEKLRWIKEMEKSGEMDEEAAYMMLDEGLRKKRLSQSIVIILISLGIGYLGGFLLTVPFYFFAFGILHGAKKQTLKYIIIAMGVTLATYLCFHSLMEVPLLRGVLWEFD